MLYYLQCCLPSSIHRSVVCNYLSAIYFTAWRGWLKLVAYEWLSLNWLGGLLGSGMRFFLRHGSAVTMLDFSAFPLGASALILLCVITWPYACRDPVEASSIITRIKSSPQEDGVHIPTSIFTGSVQHLAWSYAPHKS
jgi:hypothetical protein